MGQVDVLRSALLEASDRKETVSASVLLDTYVREQTRLGIDTLPDDPEHWAAAVWDRLRVSDLREWTRKARHPEQFGPLAGQLFHWL